MTTIYTRLAHVKLRLRRLPFLFPLTFLLVFAFSTSAFAQPIVLPINPPTIPPGDSPLTFPLISEEFSTQEAVPADTQTDTQADPNFLAPDAWEATLNLYLPTVQAQVDSSSLDMTNRAAVLAFYTTHFQQPVPAMNWTGDYADCQPGVTSADYLDATLDRINYYRTMAGVPDQVAMYEPFVQQAQAAALMMSANGQLSHKPSSNWNCYTDAGAKAAGAANLASVPGPQAIDLYMQDSGGGNAAVGHRRWLLLPQLQRIGAGSTPDAQSKWGSNALYVMDSDSIWSTRPPVRNGYVVWPPNGFVPYTIVPMRWSVSLPDADFSGATVTMLANGSAVNVIKEPIANGYGENTLAWIPQMGTNEWPRPAADTTFDIMISNVRAGGENLTITYTVVIFDPG